ncbi:hypothetical protein RN001_007467 [Aquatica leii]|uniref:2',5'-phosphodiesterase 12 n=1 Tax=Aquatica leii TaxID=1421715 RepID=A0AAN7PD54_9COLE|nr:hypothetical protein RN001_007467 [Aquatica leii]
MDKAYLRPLNETNQFQISFQYTSSTTRVNRQFNFCRQLDETISTFLSRVTTNVEKVVNKKRAKKKSDTTVLPEVAIEVKLLANKVPIDTERTCRDVFINNPSNDLTLSVIDTDFLIILNSPWINNITLPRSIMANFPVYPSKFEADLTDKHLSEFNWYKSDNKINWTLVGKDFVYTPSNSDINSYLKLTCLPRNDQSVGPVIETVSEVQIEASPGYCPFETRHQFTKEKMSGNQFRVVSYNILADLYTDSEFSRNTLFPYCPAYALNMDYRKQLILKELIGYNADIICLQELDKKVHLNDIEPVFNSLNYSSVLHLKGGIVAEGLGCIFNNDRFRIIESNSMVYGEQVNKDPLFADIWEKISNNPKLAERFTERSTVIGTVVLECKDNKEIVLVANTHLYFHPDSDHIRLLQGGIAIRYLVALLNNLQNKTGKRVSLIFCGDFNSVPECGIYQLYTTGLVREDFIDWKSNAEEAVEGLNLNQPLPIGSACGTPKFTNYTSGFADCLDYIYYTKDNLEVVQIIPLPSNEELTEHVALPSIVQPSDHIALVADLKWS